MNTQKITIDALVAAPIEKVWQFWTEPEHITKWSFASDDWESPSAQNDLRVGGHFVTKMAAKDGSAAFDFSGVYTAVDTNSRIEYDLDDGRHVHIAFDAVADGVRAHVSFDPETENPIDMQRQGWQAILNNFKKYTETN